MYSNGFLSWGFTDRREILHGSSATYQTGLLLFWGDSSVIFVNENENENVEKRENN